MVDRDDHPFNDVFEQINEMMNQMNSDMMNNLFGGDFDIQGYSYTKRPGEEPEIRTFGDMDTGDIGHTPQNQGTHVDVIEGDETINVIADLPGVEKEDIELTINGKTLWINAQNEDREYNQRVELPVKVDEESADATYNNGVLEVKFERLEDDDGGKNIEVK